MQSGANFHLFLAKDGANLHESLDIIVGVEERKPPGDDAQDNDTDRPEIDG